jgi:plasmid replication initiation protein
MAPPKNAIVVKSNKLIEASYRLDLIEQRLILAAIVEAREVQQGLGDGFITLEVARFAKTFDMTSKDVYGQIKQALNTLFNRFIVVHDIHPESGHERVSKIRWISTASYIDGAGLVQIQFTKDMVPYIARLGKEFTVYRLEKIGRMSSAHAIRLYELLVQYVGIGQREMAIVLLREILQLTDEYSAIKDFKKRVIDVAVEQINAHSDIKVSYTQRKSGRTVTHFLFTIREQAQSNPAPQPEAKAAPVIDRQYVERHQLPDESYDTAYRRLIEAAGQQRFDVMV